MNINVDIIPQAPPPIPRLYTFEELRSTPGVYSPVGGTPEYVYINLVQGDRNVFFALRSNGVVDTVLIPDPSGWAGQKFHRLEPCKLNVSIDLNRATPVAVETA